MAFLFGGRGSFAACHEEASRLVCRLMVLFFCGVSRKIFFLGFQEQSSRVCHGFYYDFYYDSHPFYDPEMSEPSQEFPPVTRIRNTGTPPCVEGRHPLLLCWGALPAHQHRPATRRLKYCSPPVRRSEDSHSPSCLFKVLLQKQR